MTALDPGDFAHDDEQRHMAQPAADVPAEQATWDNLASYLSCSQCGKPFAARACGPTHAIIAADPSRHRLIALLIAAAEQRGREDNEDHDQCYTFGSKALAALEAAATQRGRTEALGEVERAAALIHELALSACVCGGVAACFTCQTADEAVHILAALTPADEGGGR